VNYSPAARGGGVNDCSKSIVFYLQIYEYIQNIKPGRLFIKTVFNLILNNLTVDIIKRNIILNL